MALPEWSVRVPVDRLAATPAGWTLEAPAAARAALAVRFELVEIASLAADLAVRRSGAGAHVAGSFVADVVQSCVVSGEPVAAHVEGTLDLRFEPPPAVAGEVELEPELLDTMHVEDGAIDLGEAVAQSLFLALDPYPRAAEEVLAEARRLLLSEEDAARLEAETQLASNPFKALKP